MIAYCLLEDSPNSVDVLLRILKSYETASGQRINFEKSTISFSKYMTKQRKQEILHQLSMNGSDDSGLYLGMPFVIDRR